MAKERVSFRLKPCMVRVLEDMRDFSLLQVIDEKGRPSIRAWLEIMLMQHLRPQLVDIVDRPLLSVARSFEQLCELWLAVRKIERGEAEEAGLTFRRVDGKGIVVIFRKDDEGKTHLVPDRERK